MSAQKVVLLEMGKNDTELKVVVKAVSKSHQIRDGSKSWHHGHMILSCFRKTVNIYTFKFYNLVKLIDRYILILWGLDIY